MQKGLFGDEQVRTIKTNLIGGVSMTVLARMNQCSVETIRKIKHGLTYRHVEVEGEETLRPEVEVIPLPEKKKAMWLGKTEEELQREEDEVLAQILRTTEEAKVGNPGGREMLDELIVQQARNFGAKV